MNWNRAALKERGKTAFQANYWKCVLAGLVMAFITGGSGSNSANSARKNLNESGLGFNSAFFLVLVTLLIGMLIALIIGVVVSVFAFNPLEVGCQRFFIENAYSSAAEPKMMGAAFRSGYYKNVVITMFFRNLYIFLWSLLLVIPGIIKTYEYRMIPYLLADDPSMPMEEAFRRSKQMMDGQKWDAFVLDLSFIGWHLLGAITFGIVEVFYVAPYVYATNAELYLTLKGASAPTYSYYE